MSSEKIEWKSQVNMRGKKKSHNVLWKIREGKWNKKWNKKGKSENTLRKLGEERDKN